MFGKKPAKFDERNLLLSTVLKKVTPPASYDFDTKHKGIPTPMFGNDQYGDCVIAGRAHQTLRFEVQEQKTIIPITDREVITEWRKENGNTDNGLYVLDSLKLWRKQGWIAGKKRYSIKAFAQCNHAETLEVKTAIFSDIGIGIGMALPDTAIDEFNAGKPWTDVELPPNPYNGHYVFISGYDKSGLKCITWAKKQKMSWAFFKRYTDEAYAIVDDANAKKLDQAKLDAFLETVNVPDI
jgi:hypothetical protein